MHFIVEIQRDRATPPIIEKLRSKGIAMHAYGVSAYYTWAGNQLKKKSALHYSASKTITAPLVRLIMDQSEEYAPEVNAAQTRMKNNAWKFQTV